MRSKPDILRVFNRAFRDQHSSVRLAVLALRYARRWYSQSKNKRQNDGDHRFPSHRFSSLDRSTLTTNAYDLKKGTEPGGRGPFSLLACLAGTSFKPGQPLPANYQLFTFPTSA